MVRLKLTGAKSCTTSIFISIPYGSIKTYISLLYNEIIKISIPYGSIKTRALSSVLSDETISIPYGSIKTKRLRV